MNREQGLGGRRAQPESDDREHVCDAQRLSRIESALERMERGEFGFCACCGEPISLSSLIEDPTVSRCSVCR